MDAGDQVDAATSRVQPSADAPGPSGDDAADTNGGSLQHTQSEREHPELRCSWLGSCCLSAMTTTNMHPASQAGEAVQRVCENRLATHTNVAYVGRAVCLHGGMHAWSRRPAAVRRWCRFRHPHSAPAPCAHGWTWCSPGATRMHATLRPTTGLWCSAAAPHASAPSLSADIPRGRQPSCPRTLHLPCYTHKCV